MAGRTIDRIRELERDQMAARIRQLERERGLLLEACQASIELVAAAIMRGMPITPRVARARNLLVTAIAEATGEKEGE